MPDNTSFKPSIDVLFHSANRLWRGDVIGLLLTGMGSDGAAGLKALRSKGHYTIAQDAASSAIYGMPKAAAELNAAIEILPMDRMAARLTELVSANGTRARDKSRVAHR